MKHLVELSTCVLFAADSLGLVNSAATWTGRNLLLLYAVSLFDTSNIASAAFRRCHRFAASSGPNSTRRQ